MYRITNNQNLKSITIPLIIFLFLFILGSTLYTDTIIDTLYSIQYLDGGILYNWDSNIYTPNSGDTYFSCGDYGYTVFGTGRGYLSFELPDIPEGYELQNAEIFVHQFYSTGNDVGGQFPIWDIIPPPDTTSCIVDHIDYGNQLDVGDWTAGDPGDPQTLNSNIGVISDNATYEFKNLEVTTCIQEDYTTGRDKTQFRLRFMVNNDWDQYGDFLRLHTSNSSFNYRWPYIIYTWWDGVNSSENYELQVMNYELNTYPNPFNSTTTISFHLISEQNEQIMLDIYNIKGQKVKTLVNSNLVQGNHSVIWNGINELNKPVSSGVYFYKLNVNGKSEGTKKMLLLK